MYASVVQPSLYKKPLLLGLPSKMAKAGMFVVGIMLIGVTVMGLISATLFAVVYFRGCQGLVKRDSQFFEIFFRYIDASQKSHYPSHSGR